MRTTALVAIAAAALAGCASQPTSRAASATVERLYVIDCGENHAKDLSRWTPGENVGKPHVLSAHCYLVKHRQGWMLWDSGYPDRIAALKDGAGSPTGTAYRRRTLAASLKELGLEPGDVGRFAMSHSHNDHSGNAGLFGNATIYMQRTEHAALFGPDAAKSNLAVANFEPVRNATYQLLDGDHDVFGDGSVVIKSTPGHTPGHQSLFVRLARRGPVLLSGDLVHLVYSWERDIVPGFNFDVPRSRQSIARMKAFAKATGAELLVNHDREQHAGIPKAPAFLD